MQLSYLNEPSVLYNLQYRYYQNMIYVSSNNRYHDFFYDLMHHMSLKLEVFFVFATQTKAGPVLIAINPFKKVHLYGNDFIEAYRRKAMDSPHVYAITDTAIREMIRGSLTEASYVMCITQSVDHARL